MSNPSKPHYPTTPQFELNAQLEALIRQESDHTKFPPPEVASDAVKNEYVQELKRIQKKQKEVEKLVNNIQVGGKKWDVKTAEGRGVKRVEAKEGEVFIPGGGGAGVGDAKTGLGKGEGVYEGEGER